MTKSELWKIRSIGIFLVLLAVGLAGGSWYVGRDKLTLQQTGTEVVAQVVEAEHQVGHQDRDYHYLTLSYPVEGHGHLTQRLQVPEDVYQSASETGQLEIKYSPPDPRMVVFVDFPYSVTERYLFAAGFLVLAAIILWFSFRAKPVKTET